MVYSQTLENTGPVVGGRNSTLYCTKHVFSSYMSETDKYLKTKRCLTVTQVTKEFKRGVRFSPHSTVAEYSRKKGRTFGPMQYQLSTLPYFCVNAA